MRIYSDWSLVISLFEFAICSFFGMIPVMSTFGFGLATQRAAWLWVIVWAAITFTVVPLARRIQVWLTDLGGERVVYHTVLVIGVGACLWFLRIILRPSTQHKIIRFGVLALIALAAFWVIETQLETTSEAVHFVQYALLTVLIVHALSFSMDDWFIYPVSFFASLLFAYTDELLQWMTPGRYWDYRDIALNGTAVLLTLFLIRFVIQPPGRKRAVSIRSRRRLAWTGSVFFLLLGISFSMTPHRIDRIARTFPGLGFLLGNESVIHEFGHRHELPGIGGFRSRLTLDQLHHMDDVRAAEMAALIEPYREPEAYRSFLAAYPAGIDPFAHEFRVHVFRRNHYAATAWSHRDDPELYQWHCTVAVRENQILEAVFPETLQATGYHWPEASSEVYRAGMDEGHPYFSPVSKHLQTRLSEPELWMMLLGVIGVFLVLTGVVLPRTGRTRT